MINAVVDANVFISALVFGGQPLAVLTLGRTNQCKLVVSTETILEVQRIIAVKFTDFTPELSGLTRFIAEFCTTLPAGQPQVFAELRDPHDSHILQAALTAQATHVVTGDKDLLSLDPWRGCSILTSTQFVELLQ